MSEVTIEQIALNDCEVVVDVSVRADEDAVAEKVAVDLRDRAYRVAQVLDGGAETPEDADAHPVTVAWGEVPMTECGQCGFTDVRRVETDCPRCNDGTMRA